MHFLVVVMLALMLAACSSSVKTYSEATPLGKIETKLSVKTLWLKELGYRSRHHHAQLPPVLLDGALYYANINGEVGVLDAKKGTRLWKISTGETLTAGPGVGENIVIVSTRKAEIIALDRLNGAELWRSRVSSEILASPRVGDEQIIIQTIEGKVLALEADSGKQVWSYNRPIPALTIRGTSSPLVQADRVLAGFADGKLVSLDRKTGKLQWQTAIAVPKGRTDLDRLVDIDGLFAVDDATVYVNSFQGNIAALSTNNGTTLWSREISSYVGLMFAENKIFISDTEGYVWALDKRTGGTLWRQDKLKGREPSLPVIVGNVVAVGDFDGYIHWLSTEDGGIVARRSLELLRRKAAIYLPDEPGKKPRWRSISVPPATAGNRLYVRDNQGALAVFQVNGLTAK